MKLLPLIVAGLTLLSAIVQVVKDPELTTQSLPTSRISYPEGEARGVIVLLSGGQGWSGNDERSTEKLTAEGAIVIGVDLPAYYARLEEQKGDCLYLVSDIEDLSRQLHRQADIVGYHPPIVAGIGEGATLALAIAAQTPNSTISATVAVDPDAVIPLSTVLCTPAKKVPVAGGIIYGLTAGDLPNPVQVLFSNRADALGRRHAEQLRQGHPAVELAEAPGDPDTVLFQHLSAQLRKLERSTSSLNLPIVPIDAVARHNAMAVVYSGDGGWRDIDQKLAAYLKEDGIPVVGVDALRYFWNEKTPEETAQDLSRMIATYRQRWKVGHVILIGYSFGANILPATYRRLPETDRQAVSLISLLALSHQADFEIDVSGWLGFAGAGKYGDPIEDLREIEPRKIQCIYGLAEEDSACPQVEEIRGAEVQSRQGGHHFDGDYRALNRLIVERMKAVMASH
ncbi:virulence factor family protein [Rhizobium deserti]|uniref:Virulence factor family protein n=1 Tax=Rhizobium deserti TaxID=2547961 RepID=A0A4R5UKP9_9HYPH|nr:AcvB/VirJ family lysyl-phosphatidylglycerol hydrolase [Rhizobium deserti]TDK37373.1 virulence factor family protein [Rhizobium deserti]